MSQYKNLDNVLNKYKLKLTEGLKSELQASGKVASGKLLNSISVDINYSNDAFSLEVSMEDYGEFVDQGRKAGKGVPVGVLTKWIKDRKITIKNAKGKPESNIKSLAYVINKKIKEEGIKPTYFITDALEEILPEFADEAANALAEDLLDNLFK